MTVGQEDHRKFATDIDTVRGGNDPRSAGKEKARKVWQDYGAPENWMNEHGRQGEGYSDEAFDEYWASTNQDPWHATADPGGGFAAGTRNINALAKKRQEMLGSQTNSRSEEMQGSRNQMEVDRLKQLGLIQMMGNRDSATSFQRASMLNQVQDQLAQASDPRQRLRGIGRAASPMAQQMAQAGVGEQRVLEGATIGGTGAMRQGDLQTATIEQQELARQIAARQGIEATGLQLAQQAENRAATMAGSELGLAGIQAAQGDGYDWAGALVPGLIQGGAAGIAALGAMGGGNLPPVDQSAFKNEALNNAMMGNDLGAQYGFSSDGYAKAAPMIPDEALGDLGASSPFFGAGAPAYIEPAPVPLGPSGGIGGVPMFDTGAGAGGLQVGGGAAMPFGDLTAMTLNRG